MIVATVPWDGNPYQELMEAALGKRGVQFRHPGSLRPADLKDVDLVHLHWLEFLYASGREGWKAQVQAHLRGLRLAPAIRRLARRGPPLVWTMHNLVPHESTHPWLDRRVFRTTVASARHIISHSAYGRQRILDTYQAAADQVSVVHLGNYVGVYPPPSGSYDHLRHSERIEAESFVLLAFGQIRDYKRIPELILEFRRDAGPEARLIVAGSVRSPELERRVRSAAGDDARVRLELGYVGDQRVSDLHELADAAVLNYRDVFSSGVLLLSWSLGLPVIAPAQTTADELAGFPAVAPVGPGGLSEALSLLASAPRHDRVQAAHDAAGRYAWDDLADGILAVYRASLASVPSGLRLQT